MCRVQICYLDSIKIMGRLLRHENAFLPMLHGEICVCIDLCTLCENNLTKMIKKLMGTYCVGRLYNMSP